MASATSSIINQTGQNIWLVSYRSKTIRSLQKKIFNSISCFFVIVDNRDKILKNEKLISKPHTNLILGDVIAYDISNVLSFAQIGSGSDDQKTLQFCSFYGHEGNPSRLAQLTEFNFSMDHCLFLSMHIHFQMACLISKFSDFKLDEWW